MKHPRRQRAAFVIVFGVLWFIAVDWSWFVHDCPDCGHGDDTAEYRIFCMTVHREVYEFPSVIQQIATDLDVACRHPNKQTWHKQRRWGLLYCKSPCVNGIHRITGATTWYDHAARARIMALADHDSNLKAEFQHRVFRQHDFRFLDVVLKRAGINHPFPGFPEKGDNR